MTDKEQKQIFSENLNRYIAKSGKQQKEVAADIDVAPTTLGNWCTGLSMPKYGTIRKLAEYFGCKVSDLSDKQSSSEQYSPAEIERALAFMEKFDKANPHVQFVVRSLLESNPQEP